MRLVLIDRKGKRVLVDWNESDPKPIHTNKGIIKPEDVSVGKLAKTHKGYEFLILKPALCDVIQGLPCGAKPIFEYHSAMFGALLGLERGKTILEAGTGSAGATLMFANMVYPGKVYSFEKEKRFYDVAVKNVEKSGFDNVLLFNEDVLNAKTILSEKGVNTVDAIFLDLQDPENKVDSLVDLLKPGGFFGVYTPVFDSIVPVWREFEKNDVVGTRAVALTLQEILVKKYARYKQEFFGFPGFFIWGRKFGGD